MVNKTRRRFARVVNLPLNGSFLLISVSDYGWNVLRFWVPIISGPIGACYIIESVTWIISYILNLTCLLLFVSFFRAQLVKTTARNDQLRRFSSRLKPSLSLTNFKVILLAIICHCSNHTPQHRTLPADDPPDAVNKSAEEMADVFNDGNDIRKLSSGGQIPSENTLI
jgi:hypothetical protein